MVTVNITVTDDAVQPGIYLGRQGEKQAREIVFDLSALREKYGTGTATLYHQRSKDPAPYLIGQTTGTTLTWTVSETDTVYAGIGYCEFRYTFGTEGLSKSTMFATNVKASLSGDVIIPPAMQAWYDALIDYIDEHGGEPGEGIPSGGTEGQVLVKASGTDYDAEWSDDLSDLKEDLSNISNLNSISVTVAFEQGYRHLQNGCALKSSNSWCTSTVPISLTKGSTVSVNSGYKFQLIDSVAENNGAVFVSQTSAQYTAISDVVAYVEVRNDDGTNISPNQANNAILVTNIPVIVSTVKTSADVLEDIAVRSKNLFNKNDVVSGYFVRSLDGAFVANANFWRSNFIAVTGGETYTLRYINQVAFYTAETATSFISGVGGYSTNTAATPSTFVAPSNAKYIVICGHNTQLESDQLEIGDSFTGYAEYGYVVKQPSGQSYTRISDIMSKIIFANNSVKIKLIGDSTTAGQGGTGYTNDASHGELILTDDGYGSYYTNPNGYCWANLLKTYFEDHFNCTVTNFGCSGMRAHRMVLYLDTLIAEDDDIVIFMGGLNDRNDNSAHTTLQNLASDIQAIIDYCHLHDKSIIIMSPIPTLDNETGTKNFKTDDIDHVYMYAANMNGMEYISVFRKMNNYCLTSGVSLADLLNADSLHPNDTGYSIMYDLICDGLNIGVYPITAS